MPRKSTIFETIYGFSNKEFVLLRHFFGTKYEPNVMHGKKSFFCFWNFFFGFIQKKTLPKVSQC